MNNIKTYFYCDYCKFKKYNPNLNEFIIKKIAEVSTNIPKLDEETKKTVISPNKKLPTYYKCPGCGRLIVLRKIKDEQKDNNINGR